VGGAGHVGVRALRPSGWRRRKILRPNGLARPQAGSAAAAAWRTRLGFEWRVRAISPGVGVVALRSPVQLPGLPHHRSGQKTSSQLAAHLEAAADPVRRRAVGLGERRRQVACCRRWAR